MKDDVAKRFRAFIRRRIRSGAIEIDGYLDLHGEHVFDAIAELGEAVLTIEWATDSPVERRGTEVVYRLAGKYFRSLTGSRWAGPFTRLLDAMGGAIEVGRTIESITCSEWSFPEITAWMVLVDPPPAMVINEWELTREDLERAHRYQTRGDRFEFIVSPFLTGSADAPPAPETARAAEVAEERLAEHETVEEPDDADAHGPDEPQVILGAAHQAPNGRAILHTSGPPDPLGIRTDELRRADGLLRTGMVALGKCHPPQLERAERCFREALYLLTQAWEEPHPRISYALDRIGLVRHMQGDLQEAEELYLRSLKVLGKDDRPTPWNDVTLLNLARLYQSQGRGMESEAVMSYFRGNDEEGAS